LFSASAPARVDVVPISSLIWASRLSVAPCSGSICKISLHTAIAWTRNPFCA
jgi:hypothetical protein